MAKATKPLRPISNIIYMMLGTGLGTGLWGYIDKKNPPKLAYSKSWAVKGPDLVNHMMLGTAVGYIARFAPITSLSVASVGIISVVAMEIIEKNDKLKEKYDQNINDINFKSLTKIYNDIYSSNKTQLNSESNSESDSESN